ncbi:MAG: helix-turn-helix domain-containing protein [Clostridium sp.]|uniref:helix-turn-helix domain-containing protein n=1 Tax=Clostridium sp. TaxID=1506 RepID=UPI0025BB1581|nr:helix-turn-helix domain-containing protein [Clostridium sp.]MBS4958180.1 helix-turn-helix domain-containing protein [Clostridium sp.]
MQEEKILISTSEAQRILGVGRNEIYRLCNTKEFPAFKIGSKFYVNKNKLQSWADERCK